MFHHMRYIHEVYKEKSFSKAAEKLFIAQPSLSAVVKKVEDHIGVPIFDRSTSPIRLTEAGQEYIKCIERVMEIEDGFGQYLSDLHDLQAGSLAIGASFFFTSYILPPYLMEFREKYPQVSVKVVELSRAEQERKLFAGDLDLIVESRILDERIYRRLLFYQEQMILVVPEQYAQGEGIAHYRLSTDDIREDRHKDDATPAPPLSLFGNAPFLLLRQGNDTRKRADNILAEHGVRPKVALELDQIVTTYHAACQGLGIAIISDTLAKKAIHDPRVSFYRIDSQHTRRENYFYHKRNRYVTRAMREFLALTGASL